MVFWIARSMHARRSEKEKDTSRRRVLFFLPKSKQHFKCMDRPALRGKPFANCFLK